MINNSSTGRKCFQEGEMKRSVMCRADNNRVADCGKPKEVVQCPIDGRAVGIRIAKKLYLYSRFSRKWRDEIRALEASTGGHTRLAIGPHKSTRRELRGMQADEALGGLVISGNLSNIQKPSKHILDAG